MADEAISYLGKISRNVLEKALTVSLALVFTAFMLILAGAPPIESFEQIIRGSLGSWVKLSHVMKVWVPLTLCTCGLLFTFRIGLWNIGVEGQVMLGSICTTFILRIGVSSQYGLLFLFMSLLAGMTGGALWALIAGFLKTKSGVHEIFAGLGLNFVAQGIVLWLIFGPWKQAGTASMSGTETFPESLWLMGLESLQVSPAGLFLAVFAIVTTALIIRYTRTGLCLKALGNNEKASFLFGLSPSRYMLLAMFFAGGLAGLAGSVQVTAVYHRLIPAISSNYGYLALLVVLLANFNVWAAPVVAFFFACLNVGSIQLPMMLQLDSSLSGVIQGMLVLTTLVLNAFRSRMKTGSTRAEP